MRTSEIAVKETRDWSRNKEMWTRVLESRTGQGVDEWLRRINRARVRTEPALRTWLEKRGVTGYGRQLLVMERFGYPDFLVASADELVARQYSDRPALRPIYDNVVNVATGFGAIIQARKTYVSLVSSRRTFARIQPTTRNRVDLGLRLEGYKHTELLRPSRIHETMRFQISLASLDDFNDEVVRWLRRAYDQNS